MRAGHRSRARAQHHADASIDEPNFPERRALANPDIEPAVCVPAATGPTGNVFVKCDA